MAIAERAPLTGGEASVFDVGVHERLPFNQLAIVAFQNIFGMV